MSAGIDADAIRNQLRETELVRRRHEEMIDALRREDENHPSIPAEAAFVETLKRREAVMKWEIERRNGTL